MPKRDVVEVRHWRPVRVPMVPNFLILDRGENSVPIEVFTDEELRLIGEAWTKALIGKAHVKRKRKATREAGEPKG